VFGRLPLRLRLLYWSPPAPPSLRSAIGRPLAGTGSRLRLVYWAAAALRLRWLGRERA
jgi:hypothetical protein